MLQYDLGICSVKEQAWTHYPLLGSASLCSASLGRGHSE